MFDCPQCGNPLANDAIVCNGCKWQPVAGAAEPSDAALRAAQARRDYVGHAPSSADLTAQQWYNVAKFYHTVARKASEHSHRPLPHVGPDNPLDKTASPGPIAFFLKRRGFPPPNREPGEDQEEGLTQPNTVISRRT